MGMTLEWYIITDTVYDSLSVGEENKVRRARNVSIINPDIPKNAFAREATNLPEVG